MGSSSRSLRLRSMFVGHVLFVGIGAGLGIAATLLNASLPDAGFGTTIVVIVAVILLGAGLFTGWGSRLLAADRRAVEALLRGERPAPGHLAAAAGVVRVEGAALKSPLTGTDCAAYEYTIRQRVRDTGSERRSHLCYEGRYLAPTVLDGPAGAIPIRAMPSLEEFIQDDPAVERAQALAARLDPARKTGFVEYMVSRMTTSASHCSELGRDWFVRDPGQWRHGIVLEERALPVGEQVCAIGVCGSDRRSLESPFRWRFARLSVEPGTPEQVAARLGHDAGELAKVSRWCLGLSAALFVVMPLYRALPL